VDERGHGISWRRALARSAVVWLPLADCHWQVLPLNYVGVGVLFALGWISAMLVPK